MVAWMKRTWNPLEAWVQLIHLRGTRRRRLKTTYHSMHEAPDRPSYRVATSIVEKSIAPRQVSVVLPVYNEQACIHKMVHAVLAYLQEHPNYQFIFVDDGSTDRTKSIITAGIHLAKTRQIQLLSYQPRAGKGQAIRWGIDYAEGDYICYLDSDLAYSLDHLDLLIEKLQYSEVAIGCRSLTLGNHKDLKLSRKIAGKVYNFLSRKLLNLSYSDMQAGLKGFQKHAAKMLFAKQELTGFSFDVELIYLAKKAGYTISEIPAKVSDKHSAKPSKVNLVQDSIRMLVDLLTIRLNDVIGRYR